MVSFFFVYDDDSLISIYVIVKKPTINDLINQMTLEKQIVY